MDNEDIHILRELVTKGELGDVSYDRKLLVTKLEAPRSLYVMGGFSVLEAATSEGPLLVYRDTHQALVRMEHGQLCCLRSGNRESPAHVDHGCVLAYIPPSLSPTLETWVYFKTFHAARLFLFGDDSPDFNRMAQPPYCRSDETPISVRWGGIDGFVFILRDDMVNSYRYAAQVNTGGRKGCTEAWSRVLVAHSAIDGRVYSGSEIHLSMMKAHPKFHVRRKNGQESRKRNMKRKASIAYARSVKSNLRDAGK
ncbi:hypothetical protein PHYSODRAFT_320038 [Phytophthora sojae]|uniref:Uncharacterized protein n=1 Tax=Phytophthora sojae (strain P6497) TaxID=1094619 RepID=G5AFF7_PHYSP|nr:hypothetical protein PHYSODRAFT_320038 [Phytophthora sojae]EGZ05947.1 hypothetical protein PHYSODRAFT_320038 [Phytophthora sojae]|eukprot:XP_009538808.1 hypothetical protein PHYSODRAFT_320038 [Phytophthora sojae]